MIWAVWVALLGWLAVRFPDLHHGDSYNDALVLLAGRNADAHGLLTTAGRPTGFAFDPDRAPPPNAAVSGVPFPLWALQLSKALGAQELWQQRLAPLGATALSLLLVFALAARLSGSYVIAAMTAAYFGLSRPLAEYADSLSAHAYALTATLLTLWAWLRFEAALRHTDRCCWLTLAAGAFFFVAWLTPEPIALVLLFVGGRAAWLRRARIWGGAIRLALVPLLALGVSVALDAIGRGSVVAAVRAHEEQIRRRVSVGELGARWPRLLETWGTRLGLGAPQPADFDFLAPYPLLSPPVAIPAAALVVVLLCAGHLPALRSVRRGLLAGAGLLIAGAAYFAIAPADALVHRHLVLLLMPGLALLLGSLAAGGLLQLRAAYPRGAPIRWFAPSLVVAALLLLAVPLRDSPRLNQAVALNATVAAQLRSQADQRAAIAAVPFRHPEARRFRIGGVYPDLAWTLRMPFAFVESAAPGELRADERLWLQYWSDQDRPGVLAALERFGVPSIVPTRTAPTHMLFAPDRAMPEAVTLEFERGLRLVLLELAPTTEDAWRQLLAVFEGPAEVLHDPHLHWVVQVTGAGHAATAELTAPFRDFPRDERRALLWVLFRPAASEAGQTLGLGVARMLTDPPTREPLRVVNPPVGLPGSATLSASRESLLWTPG